MDGASEAPSVTALLRELADGGAALVRSEARLARAEAGELVSDVGMGSASVAGGGVLLFIGALASLTGVVLLIGDAWLRDNYALAAAAVTLVAGLAAAYAARRARHLLSPAHLAPHETVATLKEDAEWLKRQRT